MVTILKLEDLKNIFNISRETAEKIILISRVNYKDFYKKNEIIFHKTKISSLHALEILGLENSGIFQKILFEYNKK